MKKNSVYNMTDRELRAYKRALRRQREIRRRCMMVVATFCLIFIGAISYHALQSNASTGEDSVCFKYYTNVTVAYGENLWDIADNYMDVSQYNNKADYIAEIKSINHLDNDGNVKAGQKLILPYYSNEFVK